MKKYYLNILFFFFHSWCFCQKPPIDTSVFGKWPSVREPAISNDGNYALYTVDNRPIGSRTVMVNCIRNNWKIEMPYISKAVITQDSKFALLFKPSDTLIIATLGTSFIEYIPHVKSYKIPQKGTGEWLTYMLNQPERELVVNNLKTHEKKIIPSVVDYFLSDDGRTLLLKTETEKDNGKMQSLLWMDLPEGKMNIIWQGTNLGSFAFDLRNKQLAFLVEDKVNNQSITSLWYYRMGINKGVLLTTDREIDDKFKISKIQGFNKNGNRLFIFLKGRELRKPNEDVVKVDVWSYTDTKLQSEQLMDLDPKNIFNKLSQNFTAIVDLNSHRIIRLEQENEQVIFNEQNDDFVLISHLEGDAGSGEWNWNPAARKSFYLLSTKDGERKLIKGESPKLSTGGKYVIYYSRKLKNYFSLATTSGFVRNITESIPTIWTSNNNNDDTSLVSFVPIGIGGWLKNDSAVLIYDRYDIWQIDPTGVQPPINLTNGFGHRNGITFRLCMTSPDKVIADSEVLILSAFNRKTKENGFYSRTLRKKGDLKLLTMGPYIYFAPGNNPRLPGLLPQKARDTETYLVQRMNASESPNYFSTSDFKMFNQLSDIHPETEYNWLTTELITYKTRDGNTSQGILYKPEDFDHRKRYPVIFCYYETKSDQLNSYKEPEPTYGEINIPWFVSNGYLVFTPDIHFKVGALGESVFNSIVSASSHLSKMSWVDNKKLGIQGHSFGGLQTNYLITHTNIFAAAVSGAGISNCISDYGSLTGSGDSRQGGYEIGHEIMRGTLWEHSDWYIKNSPIFLANKVTTPLLMMHNKMDGQVPFTQGVEFFTALRRLRKRVWMLQYDEEGHILTTDKASRDYNLRITQFFDHYLKGAAPPRWMTQGIPAALKGIETGYKLDLSGKCGKGCEVCLKLNEQFNKHPELTNKPVNR